MQDWADGAQLVVIRHAPAMPRGRLYGRTDAGIASDLDLPPGMRAALARVPDRVSSPARRCRETAALLWPGAEIETDALLWEQDFGAHDGLPFEDLPDLGPLSGAALADYSAPGGESFADLCARTAPAFDAHARAAHEVGGPRVLVAHAGVARAALAWLLDDPVTALRFEIAPLSVTRLRVGPEGPVSVIEVNRTWG
ncbi:histidine phosphatase family protein [Pseudoponticoccus marisrubri]|uniref:Phosphoglycerate mutase n=1 Tax=Pseudoponticoccus marisrubri TaxID=1685382 RepID=A0A0W7WID4_9RHOB|nr:histidine phosphatase family protein [Pseudoponticoccus marisrubri]KUF10364.1 hypothetical protein AVJ23_13270 [Pseudoponticoccus marisrubri]